MRESISAREKALLRNLARRVAEAASLPIMAERRDLWRRHNRLERVRPMILVFPEGSWRELLPQEALACESRAARAIEGELRRRLYYHEHFLDDTVISAEWPVSKVIRSTGWGLEPQRIPSPTERGAWAFDPVIHGPEDLKKLRFPDISYDEARTRRNLETAQDLFGDLLDVRLRGARTISFHLMQIYCYLRGLDQVLMDMVDRPAMLHDAMAFLEEGHRRLVQQYEEMDLLDLNNDGTYHSSGGVGFTDELPRADFDGRHARPCDMWASAESQELALVSPEMHREFALEYEKRLLAPFGLNGYGCCEDLTRKLDDVLTIPRLRRVSISPFADVEACAEKLGARCIFSWKPHPGHLVGGFDRERVRDYITRACEATKGCVFEMILKDTHTCDHHPERFTWWTEIARDVAERY